MLPRTDPAGGTGDRANASLVVMLTGRGGHRHTQHWAAELGPRPLSGLPLASLDTRFLPGTVLLQEPPGH